MQAKKRFSKLTALVLALALLFSVIPAQVFATESILTEQETQEGASSFPEEISEGISEEILEEISEEDSVIIDEAILPVPQITEYSFQPFAINSAVDNIYIRIETDDMTLLPQTQIPQLDNFDLTKFGLTNSPDKVTALHALIKGLELSDLPADDKDILDLTNQGYINSICGLENTTYGSWMYAVNDKMSESLGVSEYELQAGDCVTVFYTPDWMYGYYSRFDKTEARLSTGDKLSLTLTGENIMYSMFGYSMGEEPIEGAEIYISKDGAVDADQPTGIFTDEDGKAEITFNKSGEYLISAVRYSEDAAGDVIDISRPYCKVTVSDGAFPAEKTVYVRIEGNSVTKLPRTEVSVSYFDLAPYGITQGSQDLVGFHAVIKALEDSGYDPLKSDVFGVSSTDYGCYLNSLLDIRSQGNFSWLYLANDTGPWVGLDGYVLSDGDDIVLYYMDYNGTAVYFDKQEVTAAQGESFELALGGDSWGEPIAAIPNAIILISENGGASANTPTAYKTDENGKVSLSFNETGEYLVSAVRYSEDGSFIDISRPYCKVTVTDGGSVIPAADKTALNALIDTASGLVLSGYTETSRAVLLSALNKAKVISKKAAAAQDEVDFAIGELQSAIDGLVAAEPLPPIDFDVELQSVLSSISQAYGLAANQGNDFLRDWQAFGLSVYGQNDKINNTSALVSYSFQQAYNNGSFILLDMERSVIAITSLGIDAKNVPDGKGGRYDSIDAISNYNGAALGTLNAYIYALLAYDSGEYELPENAKWTREIIIDYILSMQNSDGGWPLVKGNPSSEEITAMAISALAGYDSADSAVNNGIAWLSSRQKEDGGFGDSAEISAQVIAALSTVGIDAAKDTRFIKNNKNVLDHIFTYKTENNLFKHVINGSANIVATEQAFYALAAYDRFVKNGGNPVNIYRFGKVETDVNSVKAEVCVEGDDKIIVPSNIFTIETAGASVTVLDAAKTALTRSGIDYVQNGKTITSVQGVEPSENGFYFTVNGTVYNKSMHEFIISENDKILIYYGEKDTINVGNGSVRATFDENVENPALKIALTDSNQITLPEIDAQITGISDNMQMQISDGTVMTVPDSFDGYLMAPRIVNVSVPSDKTLNKAVKVGTDLGTVTFSKPVRLFISGADSGEVGFINSSGAIVPITTVLSSDDFAAAEAALTGGITDAKFKAANGTVIWTKHFTTFVSYTTKNTPVVPGQNIVSISVIDPNPSKTQRIFLSRQSINFTDGMTAISLLNETGLWVETDQSKAYVKRIGVNQGDSLGEFDEGPLSGWMYKINGVFYGSSAGSQALKSGDYVEWLYTRDLGADLNDNSFSYIGGFSSGSATVDDRLKPVPSQAKVSLSSIHEIIDKIILSNGEKTERSDWEELCSVLNGNGLSEAKLSEISAIIAENGGNFRLITDLARTVILLQAAGVDVTNFENVNLLELIYNNKNMGRQGTNGYMFSLIAMSNAQEIPADAHMGIDKIIKEILSVQNADGGFPLAAGSGSNPDITAMAIQALAPYVERKNVADAINKALAYFAAIQNEDGSFGNGADLTSETISQLIVALASLGINPDHEAFVKNGRTIMDVLLTYRTPDGNFAHTIGQPSDDIATEQALLALCAYANYFEGKEPVYTAEKLEPTAALPDDKADELKLPGDFDTASPWARPFIEKGYALGIVQCDENGNFNPRHFVTLEELEFASGIGDSRFAPDAPITRQDIAVIIAQMYNLDGGELNIADEEEAADYAKNGIAAVMENGIMNGVGGGYFDPSGQVTREMAVTIMINLYDYLEESAA